MLTINRKEKKQNVNCVYDVKTVAQESKYFLYFFNSHHEKNSCFVWSLFLCIGDLYK